MSYQYAILKHARLVHISVADVLGSEEVIEFRTRIRREPGFDPDLYQLLDFTAVTGIAIDPPTIRELARDHVFSEKSRRAFIADSSPCVELVNQFISFREIWGGAEQIGIFRAHENAVVWLFQIPRYANL